MLISPLRQRAEVIIRTVMTLGLCFTISRNRKMLLVGFTGGELVTTEKGSYYIWIQFRNRLKKFLKKRRGRGFQRMHSLRATPAQESKPLFVKPSDEGNDSRNTKTTFPKSGTKPQTEQQLYHRHDFLHCCVAFVSQIEMMPRDFKPRCYNDFTHI